MPERRFQNLNNNLKQYNIYDQNQIKSQLFVKAHVHLKSSALKNLQNALAFTESLTRNM